MAEPSSWEVRYIVDNHLKNLFVAMTEHLLHRKPEDKVGILSELITLLSNESHPTVARMLDEANSLGTPSAPCQIFELKQSTAQRLRFQSYMKATASKLIEFFSMGGERKKALEPKLGERTEENIRKALKRHGRNPQQKSTLSLPLVSEIFSYLPVGKTALSSIDVNEQQETEESLLLKAQCICSLYMFLIRENPAVRTARGAKKDKIKVLLLGLDGAGKTEVYTHLLKLTSSASSIFSSGSGGQAPGPTIGHNTETVDYGKIKISFWDIGGERNIRPVWNYHYNLADYLIFVIDTSGAARFPEVQKVLEVVTQDGELLGVPLLLLANKQDLPEACTVQHLLECLPLNELLSNREWSILECCGVTGSGLEAALEWLLKSLPMSLDECSPKKVPAVLKPKFVDPSAFWGSHYKP